jgi:hypothetical protein
MAGLNEGSINAFERSTTAKRRVRHFAYDYDPLEAPAESNALARLTIRREERQVWLVGHRGIGPSDRELGNEGTPP